MHEVQRPLDAGQDPRPSSEPQPPGCAWHPRFIVTASDPEALAVWGEQTRALLAELRAYMIDATLSKNVRVHDKTWLRRTAMRRLRMLEVQVDAIVARPAAS